MNNYNPPNGNQKIEYYQVEKSGRKSVESDIVVESPVALSVNGEVWLTFMCTPVDLEALAVGFLYNEGLIETINEIANVRVCPHHDNIDIWTNRPVKQPDKWSRTSGCTGGVTSVDTDLIGDEQFINLNGSALSSNQINILTEQLFESQDLYKITGGVHTSVMTDGIIVAAVAEDIGRHNTLDKIAGKFLLENLQLDHRILLTTGRISSDMLQKAARLGAALIISRTSPSSLSIQMAKRWGITLIGYARRRSFRIYSYPERVIHNQEIVADNPNTLV